MAVCGAGVVEGDNIYSRACITVYNWFGQRRFVEEAVSRSIHKSAILVDPTWFVGLGLTKTQFSIEMRVEQRLLLTAIQSLPRSWLRQLWFCHDNSQCLDPNLHAGYCFL
jgi:hypothetical protein